MAESITFTSPEVIDAIEYLEGVELPPRTLSYWAMTGLVEPSFWPRKRGRWNVRRYTVSDLNRVRLVVRLQTDGLSLQRVRTILETLDTHYPDVFRHRSRKQIVIAGDAVLVRTGTGPDVQLPDGQSVFTFDVAESNAGVREFAG